MTSCSIADEVVTGFGRLGTMMGSTHYGIRAGHHHHRQGPDLGLCAAVRIDHLRRRSGKCWNRAPTRIGAIGHGWTYSAHPIGAAAGVANLKLIDKLGLVENAGATGAYLNDRRCAHALGATIRHVGDMCAVKACCAPSSLSTTRTASDLLRSLPRRSAAKADRGGSFWKRGVIGRAMPQGDIIGFAPPLCLTTDEADEIVRVTKEAVEETCSAL